MKTGWLFCGCDCGAVNTFGEEQLNEAEVSHRSIAQQWEAYSDELSVNICI